MSRDRTHVAVPRVGASRARTLAVPCVLTPQLPPCAIPHLTTDTLSILTILACHHSPAALSIPLSFPHRPSPILSTFPSPTCVLKRFPLTSSRKLPLPCVKRGFLRTAEPHGTSQLSPCAPLMSQCHVYVMPGRDVACPHLRPAAATRVRNLVLPCSQPHSSHPAPSHI